MVWYQVLVGYGNCIGIPTVAGETKFNDTYNENILVNAMAVGHAKKDKIFYSKAKGINKSSCLCRFKNR